VRCDECAAAWTRVVGGRHLCDHDAAEALAARLEELGAQVRQARAEGYWPPKALAMERLRDLEEALRDLHAEVEKAESVGVCLPDREPSLRAGRLLAEVDGG
jgi:hypothetical protein